MFFVQKLEPYIVFCGDNAEQVRLIAEHMQKLVSFLGYNHAKLKGLFGMSEAHLELVRVSEGEAGVVAAGVHERDTRGVFQVSRRKVEYFLCVHLYLDIGVNVFNFVK